MCLIVLAWRAHPDFPLIVAANRDELHERPAAPAAFWEDRPGILAGRDLTAKGTWMGVARSGRFAAVTNYRGATEPSAPHSRGALVSGFLESTLSPGEFFKELNPKLYSGFNLLAADGEELWWTSNRDGGPRKLAPGIYGLGNLLLDSPDVEPAKERLRSVLEAAPAVEALFALLVPAKIINERYGTRCSTIFIRTKEGQLRYAERAFDPSGADGETLRFELAAG